MAATATGEEEVAEVDVGDVAERIGGLTLPNYRSVSLPQGDVKLSTVWETTPGPVLICVFRRFG